MNLSRLAISACLAWILCGCGTINNQVMISYGGAGSGSKDDPYRNHVYGGVKLDAQMASFVVSRDEKFSPGERLLCALYILDIPLSAVGDTLYLPLAIPADIQIRKARETKWADFDNDGNQMPVNPSVLTPDAPPGSN